MIDIDVVIPMVFFNDKEWQDDLRRHVPEMAVQRMMPRWRNWDLEHLQIKLIKRYLPWVRDIVILLARPSQMQPWMINEGVRIVFHKDFIPSEFLPTFNVLTIEMFLHEIPGLSRHFLYFNDDMFPINHYEWLDFFAWNGDYYVPKLHVGYLNAVSSNGLRSIWTSIMANNMKLVKKELNWRNPDFYLTYDHYVSAFDRDLLREFYTKYKQQIHRSCHITRDPCCLNQYVFNHYAVAKNRYRPVPDSNYLYIDNTMNVDDFKRYLDITFGYEPYWLSYMGICFNDSDEVNFTPAYKRAIKSFLQKFL